MSSSYAPFYVDLLLWAIYLLLVLAVGLIAWSTVRGLRLRKGQPATTNGVPTRLIAWASLLVLVLTLALTYLTGNATPLMSNGKPFDDAFWLRVSDMFINTSIVLIVLAAVAVGFGMSGVSRKLK